MSKILKNATLMLICLNLFCIGKTFSYDNDHLLKTFENQFEKISNDKHYVKPGTVFVSSEGIFLCLEGQLIPVTLVECDEYGVFVRPYAFKWGQCPTCNWPLTPWYTCSNPGCPTK